LDFRILDSRPPSKAQIAKVLISKPFTTIPFPTNRLSNKPLTNKTQASKWFISNFISYFRGINVLWGIYKRCTGIYVCIYIYIFLYIIFPGQATNRLPNNPQHTFQQPTNRLSNIPQQVSQQTTTEHTTKQYTANRKQSVHKVLTKKSLTGT